ncbi:MAG: Rho termination factor N-terminal domain-containing protein [Candidatus Izemoplasmatales bacterium]|nr:Rho termination factor N-terminal domain-containing protein [Candidatus Izemoplasmatales bacterium]
MVKVTSQPVKEEVKPVEKVETKVVEIDLDSKTVAELKDMAKELNLSGYSSLRKAELIDLIKTAL